MKALIIVSVYVGMLAAACYVAGCVSVEDGPGQPGITVVAPVDYGSGVLYFRATEADFAASLAAYKKDHRCVAVEAMTGDGTWSHGKDCGYFVSVRRDPDCTE